MPVVPPMPEAVLNAPKAALHAKALSCRRGERLVFEGLDLSLGAGDVLFVRGPNGSGKTSLLRVLAGFIRPASGNVSFAGGLDEQINYVGHLDPVKPALSVGRNLSLWAELMGGGENTAAALAHFGLGNLRDLPAQYLSAGQKRRLNLARLVATDRRLWLLDEPTVGLDSEATGQFEDALIEHRANGGLAVIATHIPMSAPGAQELTLGKARVRS